MKKLSIIFLVVVTGTVIGCSSDVQRKPSRTYMPDMADSRAYETYAPHKNLEDSNIHYTNMPVTGTIKRGELFPFALPKDQQGDSTSYVASRQVVNPLPALDSAELKEAERMYLINCGICHGSKLDGNGPLYKDGNGPFPSAPKNLVSDQVIVNMPDGQMFYSITYGKNLMGSYASQLSTTQRWQIIHYIRAKQGGGNKTAAKTDSTATAAK